MTDFLFLEEMMHLCGSTVKPRLIHKKGAGLYGRFCPYMSLTDYTTADFLQDGERETPVFVRFSKAFSKDGSADTLRDIAGFATKFYTEAGDFDLICQNMPVYYTNDGTKFPALYRAMSPAPDTNLTDESGFWSFAAENPEAIHMALWLYSDRGTIKSYRDMEGYSVNTYNWTNEAGDEFLVRLKWEPPDGVRWIARQEAEFLAGFDPDVCISDLYGAVAGGEYPSYELAMQIIRREDKERFGFDLLDPTLLWPEKDIPYIKIGKMTLDTIPKSYQEEVERASFSPAACIPGIRLCENGITTAMVLAHRAGTEHRGGNA